MSNLTEQLKKGELPDNHHYYFKLSKSKEYEVGNTFCLETLRWCKDGDKIQIIREVPSYKELITIISKNDILRLENAQLKELLKECRDEIDYLRKHYKGNIDHLKNNTRLDKEINQVLGEE